ncbi:hypothetical protein PV433_16725 [Paenibacillus sp. GYB004]|uniref:hypothetical protein n=1 Tax=Paenibacillus sp. GYB004 TaxID=2994393 RepID=UPI002F96AD83
MKKVRILSILIVAAVLLGIASSLWKNRADPLSAHHAEARATIEGFYNAFRVDIGGTAPYLTVSPAFLANYRFYYGDIQGYTIASIRESGSDLKTASVQVRTRKHDGAEVTYTDTLQLERTDGSRWLISGYVTSSTEGWPKLP